MICGQKRGNYFGDQVFIAFIYGLMLSKDKIKSFQLKYDCYIF